MENATKALLIAAAVLVAILIISLGIMLVNKGDASEDASETLDAMNMQAFNSKYEAYEGMHFGSTVKKILTTVMNDNEKLFGDSQKSSETINLCLNVRSNHPDILEYFKSNSSMVEALTTRSYGVRYAENITLIQQAIKNSIKYKVWFSYNEKTGYIWEIHIDALGD